jgi:hypothetical protein
MTVTLVQFNRRRYEVIIATPSPYTKRDSLEVHKFDSFKRANQFVFDNRLKIDHYENLTIINS